MPSAGIHESCSWIGKFPPVGVTPSARYARIKARDSPKLAHATVKALQRTADSHCLGKQSRAIAPSKGKNVIIESIGNMQLSPHRIIDDDQHYTEEDCQGVVAHIAALQI